MGYRKIHSSTIVSTIKNKKYIGTLIFEGKEYPNKIEPIISEELFERANKVLKNKKGARPRAKEKYLLSGYVFNAKGSPYIGTSATSRNGKTHRYYHQGKHYIKKSILENAVIKEILRVISSESEQLSNQIFKKIQSSQVSNDKNLEIKKNIKKIEYELDNIVNAIKQGLFSESLKNEATRLEKQKNTYQIELKSINRYSLSKEDVLDFIRNIKKRHLTEDSKTSLVQMFLDKVIIHDGNGYLWFNITGETISFEDVLMALSNGPIKLHHTNIEIDTSKYIYIYSAFEIEKRAFS